MKPFSDIPQDIMQDVVAPFLPNAALLNLSLTSKENQKNHKELLNKRHQQIFVEKKLPEYEKNLDFLMNATMVSANALEKARQVIVQLEPEIIKHIDLIPAEHAFKLSRICSVRSEKDCFYWAEIAASKGHEWAKFNLAVYHNEGRKTCSKAPSKAKKLFKELLESTKNQEVRDKIRWYIGTHPEINGSFETQSSEENTNVDSLNMEASDNIKNGAAKKSASSLMGIGMQVLGGFVAVLGLAAVASGIVLLAAVSASAGLIVAGSGLAALACGLGLFAGGRLYHHWNGSSQSLNQPLKI